MHRKAIMHRPQIWTKIIETKTQTNLKLYKKHKNFCYKLYKRERKPIACPCTTCKSFPGMVGYIKVSDTKVS